MTFEEAIAVHVDLKVKLRMHVEGKGSPKLADVARDDLCALGRFLGALPADQRATALAQRAKAMHSRFHQVASQLVAQADQGNRAGALKLLDGEFHQHSLELVSAVRDLIKAVEVRSGRPSAMLLAT